MTLLILPVRNESLTIERTARQLSNFCEGYFFKDEYKIVFIDDGSTDATCSILREIKISLPIDFLRNQFDRGKGSALKTGFVLANTIEQLDDEDFIIFMDGDGQINPKDIGTLFKIMDLYDADIVIGNKRHPYSVISYPPLRKFVSYVYNIIIRILFDIDFRDTQAGIKIFKKHALDKVIEKVHCKKYAFDLELIIALRNIKLRIADAPVFLQQQNNKGSVSLISIIHTFIDTIKIWINNMKGVYK